MLEHRKARHLLGQEEAGEQDFSSEQYIFFSFKFFELELNVYYVQQKTHFGAALVLNACCELEVSLDFLVVSMYAVNALTCMLSRFWVFVRIVVIKCYVIYFCYQLFMYSNKCS